MQVISQIVVVRARGVIFVSGGLVYMDEETKWCNSCKLYKSISGFSKNKTSKDGLQFYCKSCMSKRTRACKQKNIDRGLCKCGKSIEGVGKSCKLCQSYANSLFKRRRSFSIEKGICPRCGKNLLDEGYTLCASCRAYKSKNEIDCRKKKIKLGLCACGRPLAENRASCCLCLEKNNKRQKDNVKKGLCHCGRSKVENRSACESCLRSASVATSKYQKTQTGRLLHNLRERFGKAFKNNYKTGSAVRDLGCTIEQFKVYLEEQFQEGMTWDNYGVTEDGSEGWHIDHIKPLAEFDLTNKEEQLEAVHYTNLGNYILDSPPIMLILRSRGRQKR